MKTFEEAAAVFLGGDGSPTERYADLLDQIHDSETAESICATVAADQTGALDSLRKGMVEGLTEQEAKEVGIALPCWLIDCLLVAFCNGVMIGIEMEKA